MRTAEYDSVRTGPVSSRFRYAIVPRILAMMDSGTLVQVSALDVT